jgi:tRNA threonylcarbamoyl adenosine modification protein (Sua5/YciO/YrdC/YwlC family)
MAETLVLTEEAITQAAEILRRGGVVAFPDEHSYLLLADAFHLSATARIRDLRMMEAGATLQVLIADQPTLHGIAREIDDEASALIDAFWPGPLALLVLAQGGLSWDLGDRREMGAFVVRQPRAPHLRELLRLTGPLACGLASRVGEPIAHEVSEIAVADECDLVVDAGQQNVAGTSTVIDLTAKPPRLVRRGSIPFFDLAKVAPSLVVE